jgi:hypothetical protein
MDELPLIIQPITVMDECCPQNRPPPENPAEFSDIAQLVRVADEFSQHITPPPESLVVELPLIAQLLRIAEDPE